MSESYPFTTNPKLDLVLERVVDVPPALVWEAWTRPEHLKQWFCPRPWSVAECDIDLLEALDQCRSSSPAAVRDRDGQVVDIKLIRVADPPYYHYVSRSSLTPFRPVSVQALVETQRRDHHEYPEEGQ